MKWILFIITISAQGDNIERLGKYDTMYECFREWEYVNLNLTENQSKSKVDVQIVCIQTTEQ